MKQFLALALGLALASAPASSPSQRYESHSVRYSMSHGMKARQHDLYNAMRKLWEDHITWTRLFIVSAAGDLPDKDATTARLLANQTDIGNAIKPFYGGAAGNKLTALLRDHILIAANIVTAAKAGDNGKVASENKRWFANADDIADFLSAANPRNWPRASMRRMMHDHLNLTLAEAVAQLKGDYAGSVKQYDKVHNEILQMADMLSEGLIAQFPNKLR